MKAIHNCATVLPMMSDAELGELALDIRRNGLLSPIVLDQEGNLIDGRNRLEACRIAGFRPVFTQRTFVSDKDRREYIFSMNVRRRHLDAHQVALVTPEPDSRDTLNVDLYREGLKQGQVWAKSADKKQLKRLQTARDSARLEDQWETFFGHEDIPCAFDAGEIFHCTIEGGDGNPDRQLASEFWQSLGVPSENNSDPDFVRGFADGCFQ